MDNQPTVNINVNTEINTAQEPTMETAQAAVQGSTRDTAQAAVQASQNRILLPLIALGLDFLPILMSGIMSFGIRIPAVNLLMLLSPISGLILGIVALSKGKAHIGTIGKIIALLAVALPLAIVGLVIFFFVGAATGLISLM